MLRRLEVLEVQAGAEKSLIKVQLLEETRNLSLIHRIIKSELSKLFNSV